MAKDIDLLAKNAKTYNEPGSQVFKVNSVLFFSSCFSLLFYFSFLNIYHWIKLLEDLSLKKASSSSRHIPLMLLLST